MIIISIISAFTGILISSLILPAVVSNLGVLLDEMDIITVSNLIGWLGEISIVITLFISLIVLSQKYKFIVLIQSFLISVVFSIITSSALCYIVLIITNPELFVDLSIWKKFINFLRYPSVLSILLGSPQIVWIFTTIIQIFFFNIKFYQLGEK